MIAMSVMLAALAAGPADGTEPKSSFRPEMFETLVNPACSHCVDESRRKAGELLDVALRLALLFCPCPG